MGFSRVRWPMGLATALKDLENQGYLIWDDFLSAKEVNDVVKDYEKLYDLGSFKIAGTGNNNLIQNANGKIRSDETYWLDPFYLTASQAIFWDRLSSLKTELNERLWLGLWTMEGHYSRYPLNGNYHPHLDRFDNDDQRTISMVLYFNSAWVCGDGGELRIHQGSGKFIDVDPRAGRLVCFLSSSVFHEVLTSHQVRWSFAAWWKRRK